MVVSIFDRIRGKKTPTTTVVDYDAMLANAIAILPNNSSPTARAAFYQRAKAAIVAQLKSANRPISIEAEARAFDEAIVRLEARVMQNTQDATTTPSALLLPPPEPARSNASSEETTPERPQSRPLRSQALMLSKPATVVSMAARRPPPSRSPELGADLEFRQGMRQVVPVERVQQTAPTVLEDVDARPVSRSDGLNQALRKLQNDSPNVQASALISEDGLIIASVLSPDLEESRVAGMTATLLNLGNRAAIELNRGGVDEVIVRGEKGCAILINAGRGALLLALTDQNVKLGLVFLDMRDAAQTIAKIL